VTAVKITDDYPSKLKMWAREGADGQAFRQKV
jgi:hypothetical protein